MTKLSERLERSADLEKLIRVTDENTRDISAWFNRLAVDARQAADLLEECEKALDAAMSWIDTYDQRGYEAYLKTRDTLAKLSAREKADE